MISHILKISAIPFLLATMSPASASEASGTKIILPHGDSYKTLDALLAENAISIEKVMGMLKSGVLTYKDLPDEFINYMHDEPWILYGAKRGSLNALPVLWLIWHAEDEGNFELLKQWIMDHRTNFRHAILYWAAVHAGTKRGLEVLKFVFDNTPEPLKEPWHADSTPLIKAAEFASREAVHFLVEAGYPLDHAFGRERTALSLASARGVEAGPIVELLLEAGADPNKGRDADGNSPLLMVTQAGSFANVEFLLANPRTDLGHFNKKGEDFKSLLVNKMPQHKPLLSILEIREIFASLEEEEETVHFDLAPISLLADGAQGDSVLTFDTFKEVNAYLAETDKRKVLLGQSVEKKSKLLTAFGIQHKADDASSVDKALIGFRRLTLLLDPKDGPHLKARFRALVRKMKKDAVLKAYVEEHFVRV